MENPSAFDSASAYNATLLRPGRRAFLKTAGLALLATGLGGLLAACDPEQATPAPTQVAGPTSELGDAPTAVPAASKGPSSELGDAPGTPAATADAALPVASAKPGETALAFLKAWEEKRYNYMYALLTSSSKNTITEAKFIGRYNDITEEATISAVATKINIVAPAPGKDALGYQVPFDVTLTTARVGDLKFQNTMVLRPENGRWLVDWSTALIFPQLTGTNLIHLFSNDPPRGDIRDATNQPLAILGSVYSVFVVPGKIENEEQLLTLLSQELKIDKPKIKALYANGQPDWQMPIKDLPRGTAQAQLDKLLTVKGIGIDEKTVRYYPNATLAAHAIGYTGIITEDDLKTLAAKGYKADDRIGRTGVEAWAEETLAGTKGGKLAIVKSDGGTITTLAERPAQNASNVILTIDLAIQRVAEAALANRNGSVVVMNPNDGAILALASQPSYDPNAFIQGLTQEQYKTLSEDPRRPFQNRPANGTYPTGSIFKVITAGAAMERAGVTMDTRFTCTGHWEGLGAQFAKDCYLKTGHGNITLYEAIVQSCDVFFYELGKKLDEIDLNLLPGFTKACGLGTSCGTQGISDSAGLVPDNKWKQDTIKQNWFSGDAVNLAIGQGYLLASPLQMASLYAGIATGGLVPVPRLISRTEKGGVPAPVTPKTRLQLPISAANLTKIRQALQDVATRGTASGSFSGYKVKVAAKTGTAESGKETPHAWLASFAPADRPKYVVLVMLEETGEGSRFAAPVARKVMDALTF